ncbi:transcriptional regulator FtsR [Rugosimonospora africana]|uniref:MerR family transcriptional regulator n=1 Tax=Rugosimonospora africana TaxID=556532 RepID=A0A8J3QXF5_9ACTN|nr:MerR family transcriptional regulator [Rugosimonospora africana]
MSIGEVLERLRTEFPDVTISKLRFLEAEGLVEPQRSAAGYRKYALADLARLRFVLAAQRDHYLPLRVIREQLAALDHGEPTAALARGLFGVSDKDPARSEAAGRSLPGQPASGSAGSPVSGSMVSGSTVSGLAGRRPPLMAVEEPAERPEPAEVRLSREELLARSGLSEPVLADLEQHGLVRARAGRYDTDALSVARVAAQLAEYGLEPRHLRAYRAAADREVGLFTQLVAPLARQTTPAARARAAEAVRELTALSQQLHAALVRAGLRDTLGQ